MRRCGGEVNRLWAGVVGLQRRVSVVEGLVLRGFGGLSLGLVSRGLPLLSSGRVLEFGDGVVMDSVSAPERVLAGGVGGGVGGGMEGGVGRGVDGSKKQQEPGKCQLWLPKKRRFCASHALPGLEFCGNHKPLATQTRVPCPIDPSHTILQEDVASHIKKCPAIKQLDRFEHQLYYSKGINAGSDDDADETSDDVCSGANEKIYPVKSQRLANGASLKMGSLSGDDDLPEEKVLTSSNDFLSSGSKRAAVSALPGPDFENLVARIDRAFAQASGEEVEESVMQPQACRRWLDGERDRRVPYQEKHALQQASLLGNMEAFGLLEKLNEEEFANSGSTPTENTSASHAAKQNAIVELGAGRGYLSHMLCDCYTVHKVVMVERRAYKFKADRTMRQSKGLVLERLRLDIEDLNLSHVKALQDSYVVAISKHLCGPATDLSLRCCLSNGDAPVLGNTTATAPNNENTQSLLKPIVDGLAIATCCHHLCQWKSYVNKKYFKNLGFSKDDFHAITWLTSWALSGTHEHELPDCDTSEGRESVPAREPASETVPAKALLSEAMNAMDATQRFALGKKCKRLIDMGRLLWVREKGMQAKLVEYIADTVSPENKVLLAKRV
ncbi:hypothetical protein KC19_8G123200 [Ceratodon purpureus]|uniref:tRNA:m(4)X modification enzyme TRM13 n=1 Tax=Ceratodon purpureus TaxID=3225 RepID=A0A8T0H2L7_CERPU|nr:hypothetical protein KC19_8G123200 [Ceratodon purpureus]